MKQHWTERSLTPRLTKALRQFPAVLVSGARQAGKTALCRHVWPAANYVSLDLPAEADSARSEPETFLQRHPAPLIVDEIQYAPELLRYMKATVDQDKRPGQYLITGSQDFALMQGVTESLAGRCAVLTLPTLSLTEVGARTTSAIDNLAWRGGWPELHARPELDRELWLGSYLATYLERDVRNMLNIGSLRDFDRFLRAAAYRTGQLLSLSEMARDVGIAVSTAKTWISLLAASHQLILLEPWRVNPGKRLIKSPKLYFQDTGLLLYLFGFRTWTDVMANAAWGAIWENIVVSECRKAVLNAGQATSLYYWRTVNGEEVDVLIETGHRRVIAMEVKASERPGTDDLKGLASFTRLYGPDVMESQAVVCRTSAGYPLGASGCRAVSLHEAVGLL
jgi:predicted AAA+ superfamily ATPase